MKRIILMAVLLTCVFPTWAGDVALESIRQLVAAGQWGQAERAMEQQLARADLGFAARDAFLFERERMRRIQVDFSKTREQILAELKSEAPDCPEALFSKWEQEGALESWPIQGTTWYFNRAAGNLWRIHPEARRWREKQRGPFVQHRPYVLENVRQIVTYQEGQGGDLHVPKRFQVAYCLSVKADVVPAGETIRAWLPWPQTGGRQQEIKLISVDPPLPVMSPAGRDLASVYLEKMAVRGQPTVFKVVFEYTSAGFYQRVDPARVRPLPAERTDLRTFLGEQPPHLVFPEALQTLGRQIVGEEKNPWLAARRIFQWVQANIPWAGAREYSTLESLPLYALARRHGDCGIQTMLFMALCRWQGIPARWESGWVTGSDGNMHDWCQIYLEPYGWLPVDVSHGLVNDPDERIKWFYLGGCDSYRLVVNRDHSQPVFPAKTFFRSEIVDFQRGEVEWRGGNLYFDQWTYSFTTRELRDGNK